MFVGWEDGSLTISVKSIQDDSHHIRRIFVDHASENLFHKVAARVEEAGNETNRSVSQWITRKIDKKYIDRIFEEVKC